jgi:hypothetical protein
MSEVKRKRRPKVKVIVKRPFNATGRQRGKGEQELSQDEFEFAKANNCLESGV